MARQIQIGSDIFSYPEQGESAGWGEEATETMVKVAETLNDLSGPNDILLSFANLNNNQTTAANINGLVFDTSEVQAIEVDYFILRTYDSGSSVAGETGKILGYYDGSQFVISVESTGNTGVDISVLNTGQFQYKSSNLANHSSSVIRYRAKTIDSP